MRYACTARERGGIGMRSGLKSRWSLTLGVRVPPLLFNPLNLLQHPQLDRNLLPPGASTGNSGRAR